MTLLSWAFGASLLFANAAHVAAEAEYPFAVKVTGTGKPMILIPGLSCSGEVWDGTVARFKDRFECHVLTLAGFAGQPPLKGDGPFAETVVSGIAKYTPCEISDKIKKPVL